MPTMQPSTNYVVGEIQDVQLANGETVKAVVPTFNAQIAPGAGIATEAKQDDMIAILSRPSTGTPSSVASTAAGSVGILSANADRKGATITNTDANALYLLLATGVASPTAYTVSVPTEGYYEVPFGYTGDIVGIWAADGAGAALVTEFT